MADGFGSGYLGSVMVCGASQNASLCHKLVGRNGNGDLTNNFQLSGYYLTNGSHNTAYVLIMYL